MSNASDSSESIRVRDDDRRRITEMSIDTGLPAIECVGAAVDAWAMLSKKSRDRIALGRLAKRASRKRARAA